jgi:hypothetical protein
VVCSLRADTGAAAELLLLGTSLGDLGVSVRLFFAILTSGSTDERGGSLGTWIFDQPVGGIENDNSSASGKAVTQNLFVE